MEAFKNILKNTTLDFYVVIFVDTSAFMKLTAAPAAAVVIVVTCAWFWLRYMCSSDRYHEDMMCDYWGKGKK